MLGIFISASRHELPILWCLFKAISREKELVEPRDTNSILYSATQEFLVVTHTLLALYTQAANNTKHNMESVQNAVNGAVQYVQKYDLSQVNLIVM